MAIHAQISMNTNNFYIKENTSLHDTIIVTWMLLYSIDFWSNISYLVMDIKGIVSVPLYFYFIFDIIRKRKQIRNWTVWDSVILWIITSLFTCSIPAYFDFGQSFLSSFWVGFKTASLLIFYYFLRVNNFPPIKLIKIITCICIIWVFLELYQQFTYPVFWFNGRYLLRDDIEERMGLMRFYLFGIDLVLIAFSFYLGQVSEVFSKKKNKFKSNGLSKFVFLFVFFIGILCYLSRKHIAVAFVAVLMSVVKVKGKFKYLYISILVVLIVVLGVNYYSSFSEMNSELIEHQGEGEDFVRVIAAIHYLTEFSQSSLYPFLGSGINDGVSGLSRALEFSQEIMHMYQADCGIIGYYSRYGLFGVSAIIYFIFVFIRNWSLIDNWLQFFFVMKILLLFFDFWGMWAPGNVAFAVFAYLIQHNISLKRTKPYYS